jgi:hypothetical protein
VWPIRPISRSSLTLSRPRHPLVPSPSQPPPLSFSLSPCSLSSAARDSPSPLPSLSLVLCSEQPPERARPRPQPPCPRMEDADHASSASSRSPCPYTPSTLQHLRDPASPMPTAPRTEVPPATEPKSDARAATPNAMHIEDQPTNPAPYVRYWSSILPLPPLMNAINGALNRPTVSSSLSPSHRL